MLTAAVLGNAAVLSVPVYAQEEAEFTDVTAEEILYAEDEEILLSDEEKNRFFHSNAEAFYRFHDLPEMPYIHHMAE